MLEEICNTLKEELIPKYNSSLEKETDKTIVITTDEDLYKKEFVFQSVRVFNRFKDDYLM